MSFKLREYVSINFNEEKILNIPNVSPDNYHVTSVKNNVPIVL